MQPDLVHPDLRAVFADLTPRHCGVALVTGLKRREAVLEVVEPFEELGVPLGIEHDGRETPTLRDVERVFRVAERVELAP